MKVTLKKTTTLSSYTMENFTFCNPTRIVFGNDSIEQLASEIERTGAKNVLIHYGSDRVKKDGLYAKAVKQLAKAGSKYAELGGVVPNPRLSLVRVGVKMCKEEGIDLILAIGGGSVIDSAKAIAAGARYEGDVWDFFTGKSSIKEALPVATILTIPAAGSESSMATVVTNEETQEKKGHLSEHLRPVFSLLDPQLTKSLPAFQTACGAADMLAHTLERYFVSIKNVDVTDRLLEAHMRSIIKNAKLALMDPENYDYRAELMLAGYIAHNDWLDVGRTRGDWATHVLEHELSAYNDIAHGAGLAIMFPAWMKRVCKEDVRRFAQWARNVWGIESYDDEEATRLGIQALEVFFKEIGLPTRLSEVDIVAQDTKKMIERLKDAGLGQFKKLTGEDIAVIYENAL